MSVPLDERRCPNCNGLAGPHDLFCGQCRMPLPDMPRGTSGQVEPGPRYSGRFGSGRVTEDPTMPTINPNATATGTPLVFSGPAFGAGSGSQTAPAPVAAPPGVLDGLDLTQPGQPTPPGGLPGAGHALPAPGQPAGAGGPPYGVAGGLHPSALPPLAPRHALAGANGWLPVAVLVLAVLVVLEGVGLIALSARPAAQTPAPASAATATRAPGVTPPPASQDVLYQAKWGQGALDGWSVNPNDQANDWVTGDGRLINNGNYTSDIGTAPSIMAPANVLQGAKNYAIEATIEVLGAGPTAGFGFFVAYTDGSPPSGYILGISTAGAPLSQFRVSPAASWPHPLVKTIFSPGASSHRYRIEVRDGKIGFLVDGVAILEPPFDAGDVSGTLVGLWCAEVRLVVSNFVVLKLP
ncbi:MAG TPA: hypothetical protein VH540_12580 [Ktedonobacterales bacterium]